MNLVDILNQHAERQQKYFNVKSNWKCLPVEKRQKYILMLCSYISEELTEVRRECTQGESRYKPFKSECPLNQQALGREIADVFIYYMGLVAVAGFSGQEMADIINEKLGINEVRTDHIT